MLLQQLRFFGFCHTPANFCGIFLDCKSTYFLKFYFFSMCCCMFCISAFLCYWVSWRCCCCVLQLIVCTCGPRDIFCNLFFTLLMGSGPMWLCVCMCVCVCCMLPLLALGVAVIVNFQATCKSYTTKWVETNKHTYICTYIYLYIYELRA